MRAIYKYQLKVQDSQELMLPIGTEILSVCEQYNSIVLYAIVNKDEKIEHKYQVKIFGTGHDIQPDLNDEDIFLGTVSLSGGRLMFHVFITE